MAPCISINSLNCILKAIGSQCNRFSAAVMLCWSRRRKPRTTLAAARWTISSLCSNDPLIPQRAALPKSSLDVTSACTSVLRALTVRDDRIRLMHRSCAYGPFLLKLPYYHQKMYLVFDIFCFYKFYIFLHDNGQVYLS